MIWHRRKWLVRQLQLWGFRKRRPRYEDFITYHRNGAISVDYAGWWMTGPGGRKFQRQCEMLDRCFASKPRESQP